ncbi:MAG: tetratricopeptide repeat protein, partial [Gammaproteobacteria bacterium]
MIEKTIHRSPFLLALIVGLTLVAVPTASLAQEEADIELVPHPDLEDLKPEIRTKLEPAVTHFREQRSQLDGQAMGLAYGRMGIHYLAHEQQEAAGACFRNAIALNPENPRWPYYLAVHYEETGALEEAAESYFSAIELNPGYAPAQVRTGRVLLELDRVDEAEAAFKAALQRDNGMAAAFAGLGQVEFARGNYPQAIERYEHALSIQPEATQLHYRLGLTYRAMGDTEKAKAELAKAGERMPSIPDPILGFLQAHSQGAEHFLSAGRMAEQAGRIDGAIQFYDVATTIEPGNIDALMRLGQLQGASGDLVGALSSFGKVHAIDPANASANFYIGSLLEQRGEELEAESYYRAALETSPQLVEPRMLLANSLMRRREFSEAGDHYAQIAHQLPDKVEVSYLLGLAWVAAGECQWAHPVLLRALKMKPNDGQVMIALSRTYSTCAEVTEEQRTQALDAAMKIYAKEGSRESAETLAMAAAANGLFDDAVEFQAQAIFEALKTND